MHKIAKYSKSLFFPCATSVLIALSIIVLFAPLQVSCEILERVVLIGNQRTSYNALIQHAGIKIGKEFTENEYLVIKENLSRSKQFLVKSIDFSHGTLKIQIEEKWTLFPIPMLTQSGNYYNRGITVYDNNFLGSLGTFAPAISWTNSGLNGLIYYQDETLFSRDTGIKFLFLKKSDLVEFERNSSVIDTHEPRLTTYLITPNFLYNDHVFKLGPVYIEKSIYNGSGLKISEDQAKGIIFRHHWNKYKTVDLMYDGFVTTYNLFALKGQSNRWTYLHEGDIRWSIPYARNFVNFRVQGHYVNDSSYLYSKNLGGEEMSRGYDKSSLPTQFNLGILSQYQQHISGRFFLSPFYEYNSSKLINPILSGKQLNENSIGVGLRYYFKKVAIPAVVFDFARNIEDKSNHFHINVGLSL